MSSCPSNTRTLKVRIPRSGSPRIVRQLAGTARAAPMRAMRRALALAVLAQVPACEEPWTELEFASTVGSEAAREPAVGRLAPAEIVFRLGPDLEPEVPLFNVTAATLLSDSLVVVGDGSGVIRFVHTDGTVLAATGSMGDGPGEFREIEWIDACPADSVAVFDSRKRSISVFSPRGEHQRTFVVRTERGDSPASTVACAPNGQLIAARPDIDGVKAEEGPYRVRALLYLLDADGEGAERLFSVPGWDRYRYPGSDGLQPFGRSVFVAAGESTFAFGSAEGPVIHYVDRTAPPHLGTYTWAGSPRSVEALHITAFEQRDLQRAADRGVPQRLLAERRSIMDEMRYPLTFPAYSQVLMDDQDRLWVREYAAPRDSIVTWQVFDGDRRWRASVSVHTSLKVLAVRKGTIVGVEVDEVGREYIVGIAIPRQVAQAEFDRVLH